MMDYRFSDGELTQCAFESTYDIDYSAEEILDRGVSYIQTIADSNFFLDRLKIYIRNNEKKLDFKGNVDDINEIYKFVEAGYKNAGMIRKGKEPNSYNMSSVKDWISNKRMPSREKAIRFCFALQMNVKDAEEFLLKGCLIKPFNFKSIPEDVYYFCLNKNKNYQDALRIISKIDSMEENSDNQYPDRDTAIIREKITHIEDEEELIKYIHDNKKGFKKQSVKALETLKELLKDTANYAEWERENFYMEEYIPQISSEKDINPIMNVILGYHARSIRKGENEYTKSITESNFPSLIKKDFPQAQQLGKLLKANKPSEEGLRKCIILFTFYRFFIERKFKNEEGIYFDEFIACLDKILCDCGYIEMYLRNPYDWMFAYCAGANEPLDEFRELVSYFYLDDDSVYTTGK